MKFAAKFLFLVAVGLVSVGGAGVQFHVIVAAPVPVNQPVGIHEDGE